MIGNDIEVVSLLHALCSGGIVLAFTAVNAHRTRGTSGIVEDGTLRAPVEPHDAGERSLFASIFSSDIFVDKVSVLEGVAQEHAHDGL